LVLEVGQFGDRAGVFVAGRTRESGKSSTLAHLLPFVEQDNLHRQATAWSKQYVPGPKNAPTWGDNHSRFNGAVVPVYVCPADPSRPETTWAPGNYAANYQVFALHAADGWQGAARLPASIPDGLSHTLLFAERYHGCAAGGSNWAGGNYNVPAMAMFAYSPTGHASMFQSIPLPWQTACDPQRAQSPHTGGMLTALADGSVRALASDMSGAAWWAACTPAGSEAIALE